MRIRIILLVFAVITSLAGGVSAQDYPIKPVKVIVPFTAGSATDTIARAVCKKLSEMWSQPVEVENIAGAGGTKGTDAVAKSTPDGYTILINSNAFAVNTALYAKLPYDAVKDFRAIAGLTKQPYVLVVGPNAGFKSLPELLAAAKAKPGQMKFASAGMGSGTHFAAEKLKLATGIDVVHVPYKGGPEANADTVSGAVTFWLPPLAFAKKQVQEGKVVALAVSGANRSALLPDVPTIGETVSPGFEDTSWMGMWLPSSAPEAVADKLAKDVAQALASPDLKAELAKLGAEPLNITLSAFDRFVRNEMETATNIVKAAGIKQM